MPIEIRPASARTLKSMEVRFALQRDNWSDFGFNTLYHLHYRHGPDPADVTYIGGVKILKRGQTRSDMQQVTRPFRQLNEDYCSVGTSLDYYQRLNQLPERRRLQIMKALRDVVAYPDLVSGFSQEEGWRRSLFREDPDWPAFLADARILYEGNFAALPDMADGFSYTPPGSADPIAFRFNAPEPDFYSGRKRREGPSRKPTLLPERIFVLIGRNGSGKSTILSRLARVAFASPQERLKKPIKPLGVLDPPAIGFMRVITLSYSAFDSFIVPGVATKDLTQIIEDVDGGEGRFVFCGLRDIVEEVRDDLRRAQAEIEDGDEEAPVVERRTSTRLKSVDVLASEFVRMLRGIEANGQRPLFEAALAPLLSDPSFAELREATEDLFSGKAKRTFLSWSTGHKITLHVIASLVAHARPRSLVLFDEPEAHLHPPLMAALMHSVRLILTEVNGFCIAATHSPVLVQETLSEHVRYVRRTGNEIHVKQPPLETFGENIGLLTYSAFKLTAASTNFYKPLDLLIDGCETIEEIDQFFTDGLSGQARAYVASGLAKKAEDEL